MIDINGRMFGIDDLNLDAMSVDDLLELVRLTHNEPASVTKSVFGSATPDRLAAMNRLSRYALVKVSAIQFRMAGEINRAIEHEVECERIYSQLPDIVKW